MSPQAAGAMLCLACGARVTGTTAPRSVGLCDVCWAQLAGETRARLKLYDARRPDRIFQLLSAIRRGVGLARIQVTA